MSLTLLAAAAQAPEPIYWVNLGLKNYLFRIGSFELRWYSLAYLAGIVLGYWHLSRMIREPGAPLAQRHADDLFFYCTVGIILGGRLGYATFYTGGGSDIPSLWLHPAELVKLWHGGMSFHGGLIGVMLAMAWVSWRNQLSLIRVADFVSVCVPFGMLFGRLANFVNGELWGRVVSGPLPWAMVFPDAGPLPRHPSQLYEAGLEGLLMIIVMLTLYWKTRARFRPGLLVGVFTTGIASARFIVEFFREPDAQLQRFAQVTGLSMGQWLTIPLILLGLFLIARALAKPELSTRRPIEIT
ncbi:prolipoprotein diacylglyceryl transferase [Novosphingobium resinovorum]|uniref:prolipoprotein diacylglyceryl transferase n=1 Tax=Novosphingobium TaxID=165696 RepID=UPI001B3C6CB1|nr:MULTISPECIES: prolipoprotein diacylglyceryl transferase [Novosphingobium]MBF7012659.1 prolipoprotein diacylglyceryl transferase [Novosphingobium sp. HR1a]WJM27392.1 prolipoprotein diacylglyceryl transferase [Novosphingobium resinovorum]